MSKQKVIALILRPLIEKNDLRRRWARYSKFKILSQCVWYVRIDIPNFVSLVYVITEIRAFLDHTGNNNAPMRSNSNSNCHKRNPNNPSALHDEINPQKTKTQTQKKKRKTRTEKKENNLSQCARFVVSKSIIPRNERPQNNFQLKYI